MTPLQVPIADISSYKVTPTTVALLGIMGVACLYVLGPIRQRHVMVFLVLATVGMVAFGLVTRDTERFEKEATHKAALFAILSPYTQNETVKDYFSHLPHLSEGILAFYKHAEWIDPHEMKEILKSLIVYVEMYAMTLASNDRSMVEDSAQEMRDLKRDIMNRLGSYYVRDNVVHGDPVFKMIMSNIHGALVQMLKTLSHKHVFLDPRPPVPFEATDANMDLFV